MATNGLTTIQVTAYDFLQFHWFITNQDIENNASTVSWTLKLIAYDNGKISSTSQKVWSVNIDGQIFSGTNTVGIGNNETKTLASGSKVITHNADGTKTFSYNFNQSFSGVYFSGTNIGIKYGSGTGVLDAIPRAATITGAPNFTDSDNPTITYSNPAGNAVYGLQACISWTGADDIAYRDISPTGTSYTFNLTDAERAKLRAAVTSGTSVQVRFYVTTWFAAGGAPQYSTLVRTFTISNAHPTITSFIARDANDVTTTLTGNPNIWVNGRSVLAYEVTAQARQDATIAKYEIKCGKQTETMNTGNLVGPTESTIWANVTDSRGNTTTASIQADRFIEYIPLSCGVHDISMHATGRLDFTISGNYYNGSFGAADNTLRLSYRFKVKGGDFTSWTTVTPTITDKGYSYTGDIPGLDYTQNYVIQAKAIDEIVVGGVTSKEYDALGSSPIFDWSESDFNFNVPVNINGGLTIDGQPIGGGSSAPDYVIEQAFSGYWSYRKWNSGLCEMWGWCQPVYQAAHYMSVYAAYPVTLTDWISALGTLNSFTGNTTPYLTTNVKVEPTYYGCNVWVQNSNNSFSEGQNCDVSLHIVGKWK